MIFLSYKSEDANLVRGVAERLLALDIDLWFNEYRVMPENYDAFQASIDQGIENSTHAIVFTNDRWSAAEWCQYEMRGLLRHLADKNHILEICIPKENEPHLNFKELSKLTPIVFQGNPRKPTPEEIERLCHETLRRFGMAPVAPFPKIKKTDLQQIPRLDLAFVPGPFAFSLSRTEKFEWHAGSRSLLFVGNYDNTKVYLDFVRTIAKSTRSTGSMLTTGFNRKAQNADTPSKPKGCILCLSAGRVILDLHTDTRTLLRIIQTGNGVTSLRRKVSIWRNEAKWRTGSKSVKMTSFFAIQLLN